MATIIPIGQPRNDDERLLIAHLRDTLPDSYTIVHNFELPIDNEFFEIDLAIIAPHAVYLVDAKGTQGSIECNGGRWYPSNRPSFPSPVGKLRMMARVFNGLLSDADQKMKSVYIDAVVVLTASSASLVDMDGRDKPSVWKISECCDYFRNASRVPDRFNKNASLFHKPILNRLRGKARPSKDVKRYDVYQVKERLGTTTLYTEYRAFNYQLGEKAGYFSLKVYCVDPYSSDVDREKRKRRIQVAYSTLIKLPGHPAICGIKDFRAADESESQFILVSEEPRGKPLRMHIMKATQALTRDQKFRVIRDILGAIAHAHAYGLRHRNLNPDNIIMGEDGQPRLVNFDYARGKEDRTFTVANELVEKEDDSYMAPELYTTPESADEKADIYSLGVVFYELICGQKTFGSVSDAVDLNAVFPIAPSQHDNSLPVGFDSWLQSLCCLDASKRPSAREALVSFEKLLNPGQESEDLKVSASVGPIDYSNLPPGTELQKKFRIEKRLGKGGFGVVYKVFDMLADENFALKIIYRGMSKVERLKQEYKTLRRLQDETHPNVVKVHDAAFLDDEFPYLVFQFIDGFSVEELIREKSLALPDAYKVGCDAARGLAFLHDRGIYHCDIKPGNLMWTDEHVVIIDFNVSFHAQVTDGGDGGSRKYLPPEYDLTLDPTEGDRIHRDIYALGVTLYECVTGQYPWPGHDMPPHGADPKDPREYAACMDLADSFVACLLKAIHPIRNKRYQTAKEFLTALEKASTLRTKPKSDESTSSLTTLRSNGGHRFLDFVQSMYSQSERTNAGTRGLDALGLKTYIDTALDRHLTPAVLDGSYNLVVVTGNAGDGKTAFLQQLEKAVREKGGSFTKNPSGNGNTIQFVGKTWLTNYDGSQDEGNRRNNEILLEFFAPFAGNSPEQWKKNIVHIIAINEGRLIDFLDTHYRDFPYLTRSVRDGLRTATPSGNVAVVNLNLRSITADGSDGDQPIFDRILQKLTSPKHWEGCHGCELEQKCYIMHNVRTFSSIEDGRHVIERLRRLYSLTGMRNRLHITIRDLRSALAYMVAGTRSCKEIRALYADGDMQAILNGFYFNSWMGSDTPTNDRLLNLLREVDVGNASDPRLDRALDFRSPEEVTGLRPIEGRSSYDRTLLAEAYRHLPLSKDDPDLFDSHQRYLRMLRRLFFFERRDRAWEKMLPYQSSESMVAAIGNSATAPGEIDSVIAGINRGEGLFASDKLAGYLALRVRQVEKGTIRSYRLFPSSSFKLEVDDAAKNSPFVEHVPTGIKLVHMQDGKPTSELLIDLDIYEMLSRLNQGYKPTVEELQGYYQGLTVFKNHLAAAPYNQLVLTVTGQEFYKIVRDSSGVLTMSELIEGNS